ncbi:MAG: chorismate mutase [Polyangiaceae bacterium]
METDSDLQALRERIDGIDRQLLALLAERVRLAIEVGRVKRRSGLPIYDPERERAIFESLCRDVPLPLNAELVRRVFERIVDETRAAEQSGSKE